MRILLTMCVLCATTGAVDAAEKAITCGEMTSWRIVCDSGAIESERYAANEFQALFAEMTGKTLEIVDKPAPGIGSIFIGPDAVTASGRPPTPDALGEEGLRIGITENAIYIDGGRPRGTLYGVYEFLRITVAPASLLTTTRIFHRIRHRAISRSMNAHTSRNLRSAGHIMAKRTVTRLCGASAHKHRHQRRKVWGNHGDSA